MARKIVEWIERIWFVALGIAAIGLMVLLAFTLLMGLYAVLSGGGSGSEPSDCPWWGC